MLTDYVAQAQRLFHVDSPLGGDVFLLRSFSGHEGVSELFHFDLEVASDQFDIPFDQIVDKRINVAIRQADGFTERNFNGFVKTFRQVPAPGRLARYHAEVVPWLWYLTLSQDCRIWQHKAVPDIIQEVFQKLGFRDYEFKLRMTHSPWEYCTQYRETAYTFVSRLMEMEGMYYFFRHEKDKHTLVIVDHRSSHEPCPYQSVFRYDKVSGSGYKHDEDTIHNWIPQKTIRPARWTHKDYNYLTPQDPLLAGMDTTVDDSPQEYELYDFPGDYEQRMDADEWARLRIEEQEYSHQTADGSGNCRALISGYLFTLTDQDRADQNQEYLITHVQHTGQEGTVLGGTDTQEAHYENTFRCMPSSQQYRHKRNTERAKMMGCQTGFVVGPPGEEIHTDEWGRVRVKWHWDRTSALGDDCSCWVRVMQHWSDNRWGYQWIPRVGEEVIIDFLEGDPDRPIITGCVYNAKNRFPYKLPDKKTVSGIKSNSTPGGNGYNEIRFDDQAGSELFAMHSQKDKQELILHDHIKEVQNNEDLTVGADRKRSVGGDEDITVGKDRRIKVGGNLSLSVGGDRKESVGNDFSFAVTGDRTESVGGSHDLSVAGDQTVSVDGSHDLSVGGDQTQDIAGDRGIHVGGDNELKVDGDIKAASTGSINFKAGDTIVLEAGMQVVLKGPGGFITIDMTGVTIQGTMVNINCGSPPPGGADDADPDEPDDPEDPDDPDDPQNPKTPDAFTQAAFGNYTDQVQDQPDTDTDQYDQDTTQGDTSENQGQQTDYNIGDDAGQGDLQSL